MHSITVRHNIEVAHRLYLLPGRCENIHGHSIWVALTLHGEVDKNGILDGLDFGSVKSTFRSHLDEEYDHHLLLNQDDPWAGTFSLYDPLASDPVDGNRLPGLKIFPGDPTTENLARWIGEWSYEEFRAGGHHRIRCVEIEVQETHVNSARWKS